MATNFDNDVYGSGLQREDWYALLKFMMPFIHCKDPSIVEIPSIPEHLKDHPLVRAIYNYRSTGDDSYLDQAGRFLCPTDKPFGWYVVLTKS
ncbi:MAG: hypothetical protein K6U80_20575 [Firmicutes bacterium]|nr:hypothetical protein [Bacillota bacterium]